MQVLKIDITEDTPEVIFDIGNNKFSITGRSLPENAYSFFKPLIDWTAEKVKDSRTIELVIELDYFNSSSGRYLLEMLDILQKQEGNKVTWKVDGDDDLMIEKGEEIASLLKMKFEIEKV